MTGRTNVYVPRGIWRCSHDVYNHMGLRAGRDNLAGGGVEESMKVEHNVERDFGTALYESTCAVCDEGIEWECSFDADGSNYTAECCGKSYMLFPSKVRMDIGD